MKVNGIEVRKVGKKLFAGKVGEEEKRLSSVQSSDLFDVLVAIVNTAQKNPARCMADVCNDNFAVHGVNLRAEMTDDEDTPVKIERTSNGKDETQHDQTQH